MEEQTGAIFAGLVRDPQGRKVLQEEGAIEALAELLEGGATPKTREYAVSALLGLAVNSKACLAAIDEEGIYTSIDVLTRNGSAKTQAKVRRKPYSSLLCCTALLCTVRTPGLFHNCGCFREVQPQITVRALCLLLGWLVGYYLSCPGLCVPTAHVPSSAISHALFCCSHAGICITGLAETIRQLMCNWA